MNDGGIYDGPDGPIHGSGRDIQIYPDKPVQRIGSMFYQRIGVSTEFWTCEHGIAYPDICDACGLIGGENG